MCDQVTNVKWRYIIFYGSLLPAQGSQDDLGECLDKISACIENREENATWCIMGDFNGDVGNSIGDRGTRAVTTQGRTVARFFKKHNLCPCNMLSGTTGPVYTFESHNAQSTINYVSIPTHLTGCIVKCSVVEGQALNNSDHLSVRLALEIDGVSVEPTLSIETPRIRWDKLSKADIKLRCTRILEPYIATILESLRTAIRTPLVIDQGFSDLTSAINTVSEHLLHSKFKRNLKPFWNQELSNLKSRKVVAYHQWVAAGRPRVGDDPLYCV